MFLFPKIKITTSIHGIAVVSPKTVKVLVCNENTSVEEIEIYRIKFVYSCASHIMFFGSKILF